MRAPTFLLLVCLSLCLAPSWCVWQAHAARYYDQVGRSDWIRHNIGRVDRVWQGRKALIVATNENVLAALSLRNGTPKWRHILGQCKKEEKDMYV